MGRSGLLAKFWIFLSPGALNLTLLRKKQLHSPGALNSSSSHFDASEPHIFCHRHLPPGGQLPQRNRTTNPLIIHTLLPTPRTTAISRPPRIPKSSNPQPRLHQRHRHQPTKQRPRRSLLTCRSPAAARDLQRVAAGHRGRQQSEINQNYVCEMQQSW